MKHEGVKRCPNTGSCYDIKCLLIQPTSPIQEFDNVVNNSPGFTYCREACGGWGCGCFLFETGCLFYRTYAEPIGDTVYEVFSCPRWHYNVEVSMTISEQNNTRSHTAVLLPATINYWDDVQLTLTSISTPPAPILGSQFLTDGSTTVMTRASVAGQPVSGVVGSLQCSNKKAAKDFTKCSLPHDSCNCDHQDNAKGQVTCTCVHGNLDTLLKSEEHILPMKSEGISILPDPDKGVIAEYEQFSVLEVQINLQGYVAKTQIDQNLCIIQPLNISGCYSCLTAATFFYQCTTDFGSALAHVDCEQTKFSVVCDTEGMTQMAKLNFAEATVDTKCHVVCPAGTTDFTIKTSLEYIETQPLFNISNMISAKQIQTDSIWDFWKLGKFWKIKDLFGKIADWFKNNIFKALIGTITMILVTIAAILFTIFAVKLIITKNATKIFKKLKII